MADRTLEGRARAALIREWAAAEGLQVAAQGRLPAVVVAAYRAAHGEEPEPEADPDGPDWDAAAAALDGGDDPLAGLEEELGQQQAPEAAAAANGDQPSPPPPASLDEARERLGTGQQRQPPWAKAKRDKPGKPAPKPVVVTKAVRADIEGQLVLLLGTLAVPWQMTDPYCGGAFAATVEAQAAAWAPLICQSPTAVRWFTKGNTVMLWIALATCYRELALCVYHHHVMGDVTIVGGQAVEATRLPDGRVVPKRAPAQQQAQPDWSAYTTEVAGHVPTVQAG